MIQRLWKDYRMGPFVIPKRKPAAKTKKLNEQAEVMLTLSSSGWACKDFERAQSERWKIGVFESLE